MIIEKLLIMGFIICHIILKMLLKKIRKQVISPKIK